MVYFVRMLNSNVALAEDALQDLFVKLVEKPGQFDRSRSFKTWIFSVAHNTCKNYYRHQNVVKESSEFLQNEDPLQQENFYRVAARVDAALFRQLLFEMLDTLPPLKKECFLLRYQEDHTIAEIAQIQQCAEGSVKSRLHYTLKFLEEKLKMFNPVR